MLEFLSPSCPDPEMWILVHIVDLVDDPRKPQ